MLYIVFIIVNIPTILLQLQPTPKGERVYFLFDIMEYIYYLHTHIYSINAKGEPGIHNNLPFRAQQQPSDCTFFSTKLLLFAKYFDYILKF